MILRQSLIRCWEYCPAKYRATYILGLNLGEFDPNLMYGTGVHTLVERYHLKGELTPEIKRYTDVYAAKDYLQIERAFSWYMPLAEVDFTGTIDRVAEDGLHDLKTSKVSYSQNKVDNDIQATAYLAYKHYESNMIVPFTFDILRKDKRANGQEFPLQVITTTRTEAQLIDFQYYCAKVVADIEAETEFRCLCRNQEHAIWSNVGIYA